MPPPSSHPTSRHPPHDEHVGLGRSARLDRRRFLGAMGTALAVGSLPGCDGSDRTTRRRGTDAEDDPRWEEVRSRFRIDPEWVHMAGLLIASHPAPVAEAIREHRRGLDRNPAIYVDEHFADGEAAVRSAAADYLGVDDADIAITDSTTMGLGLVYNGLGIRSGQEFLTTDQDYHATHEAIAYKANRTGASVRKISLHDGAARVDAQALVDRVRSAVRPETRVLAFTWVHSGTGLKLPAAAIAEVVGEANAGRSEEDRLLFCLDGVHGLGVEATALPELGCDFFMAGTHKWLFGPRGTGIVWARPDSQHAVTPTIPTFSKQGGWGPRMSPGGFKPFEHQWAVADAFRFHQELGKGDVAGRIHRLARRAKEGLVEMDHVRLHTPMDDELSAGIVCFEVDGLDPGSVVRRLRDRRIAASTTPYSPSFARLSPGLLNTIRDVDRTLEAIRELA